MGRQIDYPDGSTLVSSALTLAQIGVILQPLTIGMLGAVVPSPNTSPLVRLEWATQGQPFQPANEDVCYLRAVPLASPYANIRERTNLAAPDPNLNEQWNFTRVWLVTWILYGPNSLDLTRAVRDALYQDYFTNTLSLSQLFPVSEIQEPTRVPEKIQGQWFERCDLECEMYEFVTESILRQTVTTVEEIVSNDNGVIADIVA